jgi:hypothetical protein
MVLLANQQDFIYIAVALSDMGPVRNLFECFILCTEQDLAPALRRMIIPVPGDLLVKPPITGSFVVVLPKGRDTQNDRDFNTGCPRACGALLSGDSPW